MKLIHQNIPIELQTDYKPSVMITDNNILPIWTDRITDGINYVGNYYQQNHSVGNAVGIR
jgi:hypothetical protein